MADVLVRTYRGRRRVAGRLRQPVLGTATSRQKTSPPTRAAALADISLPDHDGTDVRLGDLWRQRPAALVWLRHYG